MPLRLWATLEATSTVATPLPPDASRVGVPDDSRGKYPISRAMVLENHPYQLLCRTTCLLCHNSCPQFLS